MTTQDNWPMQPETDENIIERISKKEHLESVATDQHDNRVEALLSKLNYWKLLRVTSFVKRFIYNCTNTHSKITGPDEILNAEVFWLKLVQGSTQLGTNMELRQDDNFLLRCYGRVQGYYPISIPREH